MVAYSSIVLAVLGVFVSQSFADCGSQQQSCVPCQPKTTYSSLVYNLPVPCSIPVGTYCKCQKVAIKPTLSAPVTCCSDASPAPAPVQAPSFNFAPQPAVQSGSQQSSAGTWVSVLANILQNNPGMLKAASAPQATSAPLGGCNGGQDLSRFLPALLAAAPAPAPASGGCGFAPAPAPVSGGCGFAPAPAPVSGGCGCAPAPVRSRCGCN